MTYQMHDVSYLGGKRVQGGVTPSPENGWSVSLAPTQACHA